MHWSLSNGASGAAAPPRLDLEEQTFALASPLFDHDTTLQRNIELVWIKIVKLGHSIYEFNLTFPVLRLLQLENYKRYTGRVEGVLDVIYMFIYSHPCVLAIYCVLFLQKIIII